MSDLAAMALGKAAPWLHARLQTLRLHIVVVVTNVAVAVFILMFMFDMPIVATIVVFKGHAMMATSEGVKLSIPRVYILSILIFMFDMPVMATMVLFNKGHLLVVTHEDVKWLTPLVYILSTLMFVFDMPILAILILFSKGHLKKDWMAAKRGVAGPVPLPLPPPRVHSLNSISLPYQYARSSPHRC